MKRHTLMAAFLLTLGMLAVTPAVQAVDITWDGGNGEWDDAKWNGGRDLADLVGTFHGSNGYKGPNGEEENFFIPAGSEVNYDANALSGDFRLKQGASLTIGAGAVWKQITNDDYTENRWTQLDASNLIIDGGSFLRTGNSTLDPAGGGAFMFASWRSDDNLDVSPLPYPEINIEIKNGGLLANEGQLMFGSWGDTPPATVITMTINDGTLDLTGGDVVMDPDFEDPPANADLVFSNKYTFEEDLPKYTINFTGPGSIIVDKSGIINATVDEFGDFTNLDPVTYESLWDAGILQADGKSGVDGETFSKYFTTSGALGADNYTLMRSLNIVLGDYNNNGVLDAPDIDELAKAIRDGSTDAKYDLNGDQTVNADDHEFWVKDPTIAKTWIGDANLDGSFTSQDFVVAFLAGEYETNNPAGWGEGDWNGDAIFSSQDFVAAFLDGGYEVGPVPAVSAVPEPSTIVLLVLGALTLISHVRRK